MKSASGCVACSFGDTGAHDRAPAASLGDIRVLAKKIRTNHDLALSLWNTGNRDAQFLAALLIQPKKLLSRQG